MHPLDIDSYTFYALNKYRRVFDIKWEKYRFDFERGVYYKTPYTRVNYRDFYPKAIFNTIEYFSTLIKPQIKVENYIEAISIQLPSNWYESLYDRKTSFGILKLMSALKMIHRYDNRKGYNHYYLNPVIYHDLSIRQMKLYCENTSYLFRHDYNELPRNKGDCEFTTPEELVLI
jgi:hypothetical protein